jgi:hypothetical protein
MGVQIGIPIFLGLYFQINVLVLLVMIAALVFHVWIAHCDVKYARETRPISMLESHVHSFLETLPIFTVALLICINWGAFVDLITLHWSGHLSFIFSRPQGVTTNYIASYVALMLFADVLPYAEEFFRCSCKPALNKKSPALKTASEGEIKWRNQKYSLQVWAPIFQVNPFPTIKWKITLDKYTINLQDSESEF